MFGKGTPPSSTDRDAAFVELVRKLNGWTVPAEALDRTHEGAKASLAEVKALTEYEDGKVSRLLTIIAFLSAVVGAVFTRFATDYPWPGFDAPRHDCLSMLTIAAYFAFFAYVLLVTGSVLIILGAVKPQFNVPKTWEGSSREGLPPSMLFYARILDVTAPTWGDAFIKLGVDKGDDLKAYYTKCYIAEAYLIAGKVADKLRLLSPGVGALQAAMWVLLIFFSLFGANVLLVKSPNTVGAQHVSTPAAPPPVPTAPVTPATQPPAKPPR